MLAACAAEDSRPAYEQLTDCAAAFACPTSAWVFDNWTGQNDFGPIGSSQQTCAVEALNSPAAAARFSSAPDPVHPDLAESLLIARWSDGSVSCVQYQRSGEAIVESTAMNCELPEGFLDMCAEATAAGSLTAECVDWRMWPFTEFSEASSVRCGPLQASSGDEPD